MLTTISLSNDLTGKISITIRDMEGKTVLQKEYTKNARTRSENLTIEALPETAYAVKVQINNNRVTRKVTLKV